MSTALPATTPSMLQASLPGDRSTLTLLMAATATTPSMGSAGNDLVIGGRGNDVAFWAPATTRSSGTRATAATPSRARPAHDTLLFNGANVNEHIDLSANGSRVRLFRDVGNVTMDLNGVEQVNVNALGGADTITVNDLTGTGVTQVNIDLASTPGSGTGDGQADTVIVNGTAGNDRDLDRRQRRRG